MVLDEEFMERVMTTERQTSKRMRLNRQFYGMEAVAQFDEESIDEERGED
jgi:hypothetical protein